MDVDEIADQLRSVGFVTIEDSLPRGLLAQLEDGCSDSAGARFAPGAVGRGQQRTHDGDIRGDVISWLDRANEADVSYLALMEDLRLALNERLFLGLFSYDCHYAVYGVGRHYKRHLDVLTGHRNRLLSTVVYLHRPWAVADGGELLLYRGSDEVPSIRILPKPGRMVLFLSEDFPHEVLAAHKPRHSLAGWFVGTDGGASDQALHSPKSGASVGNDPATTSPWSNKAPSIAQR